MLEARTAAHAWDVVIVGFRLNAEKPAQVLERVLRMSPAEARASAKKFPHLALSGVDKRSADSALEALRAAGARVELHPHGSNPRPRNSFVLTPSGRKSLVVVQSISPANDNQGASASDAARADADAARSDGRVSVYRLGEIEVVVAIPQVRAASLPRAPENANQEAPRTDMRPIGQPATNQALPVRAHQQPIPNHEADSAVAGRSTWTPGDFRVIDDTLSDYGDAPVALELDHRPAPTPAKVAPRKRRISLVERAHAFEASHRGTRLASIVRQARQGAGTLIVFVLTMLAVIVLLGERAKRRAIDVGLQSLVGFAEERLATPKATEEQEPASPKERVPSARANFMEMRTPGVNRVAVDWPLESGEVAHVSCLLLEDPTPSKVELVRGSRVALAIPKGVESQLRDHAETLRMARGREDLKFEQLCLADE